MIEVHRSPGEYELWLVHGRPVATQPFYWIVKQKEHRHEVKHYYCPKCGSDWGLRICPQASSPPHFFYQSTCADCGGEENMLSPFEQMNLDILSSSVLAYTLLAFTDQMENHHEIPEDTLCREQG